MTFSLSAFAAVTPQDRRQSIGFARLARPQPFPPMALESTHVFIPDLFESHGRYFPTQEAVTCGEVRRNWGDFSRNINRVANALLRDGVRKGSRVAVLMDNSVELLEVVFGVVRAGACVVPLSGLLTGEQLAGLIEDSQAVVVFASAAFRDRLATQLSTLHGVDAARRIAVGASQDGWRDFASYVSDVPTSAPAVRYALDDEFNIIYSSGTTGLPKGILQTHSARLHWAFSNAIEMGITRRSRALTTTALYSNGTWLVMLPTLFAGGTVVAMPAFDAGRMLALVERERISHTFMVPSQYTMVLQSPELHAHDTRSLEVLLSAGSPLRAETKRAVIERFGDRLIELYGYSEGYASMLKPGQHDEHFDSVGVPVLGWEIRILDDAGQPTPPGVAGEIAGHGPGMMKGYHGNPEETEKLVWRDERGRAFIRSGDIGVVDVDGFLKIVDRKKDMIISGGFNVFPSDIEAVVAQHPAVLDVAVISIPHAKWGEVPLALVVPKPGAGPAADDIVPWCNARLAKHQRLAGVEFRSEFPRNALGKVLKRELRARYWQAATPATP